MNLIKLEKQYPCTTIAQAMEVKSESFASMVKANTERFGLEKAKERVETTISLYIAELNQSLNLKRQMSEQDMIECAMLIRSEYYYLQIHHIAFIFRQAKLGVYGEFYESINTPKIMTWFADFADEFQNAGAIRSENEHKERRLRDLETGGKEILGGTNQRFAEVLKKFTKQDEKDKRSEVVKAEFAAYESDVKVKEIKSTILFMQKNGSSKEEIELVQESFLTYLKTNYPNL